jgi:hypothetical protein
MRFVVDILSQAMQYFLVDFDEVPQRGTVAGV